jgi:hypothetical protein
MGIEKGTEMKKMQVAVAEVLGIGFEPGIEGDDSGAIIAPGG